MPRSTAVRCHPDSVKHAARILGTYGFAVLVFLAAGGCTSRHTQANAPGGASALPRPFIAGAADGTHLTLTPVDSSAGVPISEARARSLMKDANINQQPSQGQLTLLTLAHVAQDGGGVGGLGAPLMDFRGRTLWVGVWRIDLHAIETSCPAQPPKPPFPPLYRDYYDAVLVDSQTGEVGVWNEDMSGYILRACANALSGRAAPSPTG